MAHSHEHSASGFRLFITILLNIFITVAQVIGGFAANSMSLLSDALHNFSDVVALSVSWFANILAHKKPDESKTFGLKRAEILAAFFNSATLTGMALLLIYHAVLKFFNPEEIKSLIVIYLAFLSIVLNTLSVFIIKDDAAKSMNIKSAYLHLLTDVMTSVAVFVGGIAMLKWKIFWVDPAISIFIAVYLIFQSYSLLKESLEILLQFTPYDFSIPKIKEFMENFEEVDNVHHIHLWRLGENEVFFEAHVDFSRDLSLKEATNLLEAIEKGLKDKFGISHTTLQPEFDRQDDKSLISSDC